MLFMCVCLGEPLGPIIWKAGITPCAFAAVMGKAGCTAPLVLQCISGYEPIVVGDAGAMFTAVAFG